MVKRVLVTAILIIFTSTLMAANLERIKPHPRIFADRQELESLKKDIASGKNEHLLVMHSAIVKMADEVLAKEKNSTGFFQIASDVATCTYSYYMTRDQRYFNKSEELVRYLCDLESWKPHHFLGVSAATFSCAFVYDWLYDEISEELKTKILNSLRIKTIAASNDSRYEHFLRKINNWNQVCNAGVVLASVCLYDELPDMARQDILDAVSRNRPIVERMFAPDGIYPEGTGYTSFGASWQFMLIAALKSAFGTDMGLSNASGLDCLGDFLIAATGPTGKAYNFSDNTERNAGWPILWVLADYYNKPYYLYPETVLTDYDKSYLEDGLKSQGYILPLCILSTAKLGRKKIPIPPSTMFYGHGSQPIGVVRTDWNTDAMYLAIKGGNPALGHSHLDVGSFIFDAHGMRWADDITGHSYRYYEKHLVDRRNLWKKTPDSPRWRLFRYNNLQHNTLTINNWDHAVTGYAPLIEVINEPAKRGVSFELTNAFKGMTMRVVRTAVIADNHCLVITDDIHASEDDECDVVWNMATPAKATLVDDGVILEQKGYTMKLESDSPRVKWFVETAAQRAERASYGDWDVPVGNTMFCGYTIKLKKSERVIISVTLKDVE